MESSARPEDRSTLKMTASSALRHPMRIRILEALNERDMSPVEFFNLGLAPKVESAENTLSHISYHFRQLAEDGCLEVVKRVPRRGATEHVYRGKARACFGNEEWEQLTPRERDLFSRAIYQGLAARVDGAMMARTFDSRNDRHLTWDTRDVDEQGWRELVVALLECFEITQRIMCEAEDRLKSSGEKRIPATVGILGFESPWLPCRDQSNIERPAIPSG